MVWNHTDRRAYSALAGYNCKCQDERGQYNVLTENCCLEDIGQYRPDLNHQVRIIEN